MNPRRARDGALGRCSLERRNPPGSRLYLATPPTVVAAGSRGAPGMARWDVTPSNAATAPGESPVPRNASDRGGRWYPRRARDGALGSHSLERRNRPGGVACTSQRLRPWWPLVSEARQGWRAGMLLPRTPQPPRGVAHAPRLPATGGRWNPRRARNGALGRVSLERRNPPGSRLHFATPVIVVVPTLQRVIPGAPRIAPSNAATGPGSRLHFATPAIVVVPTLQRVIPDAPRMAPSNAATAPGSHLCPSAS